MSLLVEGSGWLRRLVQLPVLPEPYLNCCILCVEGLSERNVYELYTWKGVGCVQKRLTL